MGRRRATAGDSVRGGVALGSPEIVESDAPGLGLACGLAGEGLREARDPLVGSARRDGDRTWLRDGDGGIEQRYIAGVRGSKGARGYGPRNLTPKGPGRVVGSHRGSNLTGEAAQRRRR